ncbi:MAG: L-tyrosine/L-tryptophan isonitrile synthase family protein [Legionellales bacterium]
MKKKSSNRSQSQIYSPGLHKDHEAVISDHFMHSINRDSNLALYNPNDFSKKALHINQELIMEDLIPSLLEASDAFILERVAAATNRIPEKIGDKALECSEIMTELMLDRQFFKGSKFNVSRLNVFEKIKGLVDKKQPIHMVIPALPFKSSSPLKSRGSLPDLAEIHFLMGLAEIAKAITLIYSQIQTADTPKLQATFTIVSDGSRFNHFLNEPDEALKTYQTKLRGWIRILKIADYIQLVDYQWLLSTYLPAHLYKQKTEIRKKVHQQYCDLMNPLLNPYDMLTTISQAILCDPEPELSNPEGRFIPLFKSLIYIVRYKTLLDYAQLHQKNHVDLYTELTQHLFEPYTQLSTEDEKYIERFLSNAHPLDDPSEPALLEYLRQSMLKEAWTAAINYIAEIRSDRDLDQEPIATCLPDYIRWTIHAKPGQLAILTTTAFGDPVQAWHGVGVFKLTKNNKIKIYTLPVLSLEGVGSIPVLITNQGEDGLINDQPLFYVHPDIIFENVADLLDQIKHKVTRKRKT